MKIRSLFSWSQSRMQLAGTDIDRLASDDFPFLNDARSAIAIGPGRRSHLILVCTALFFVSALTWSAFARIDEVTRGEGKVIPSSKVQVVQNLEGGILSEIMVKEGQVVDKDQPVMKLDDIRFASSYRETRSKYLALSARAARLKAEADNKAIVFPDFVLKEDPSLSESELALHQSRKKELDSNISILQQQAEQNQQQIEELKAKREKLSVSFSLLNKELKMSEPLEKDGAISEVEILRLKRGVNDMAGELKASELALPRLQSAYRETRSKIDDLEIKFRTDARSELTNVMAEVAGVEATMHGEKDRVSRTLVRSPVRGTVKQIMVSTIGGVIQPGMELMDIVPLDDTLLVEAHVRPSDIAFLHPDQDAMVKLTAYDFAIYGGLPAKLEHISADTITDEKGESYYLIDVRTKRSHLGTDAAQLRIIPGMTASVDILTGHKTVLDYLLKPVLRARELALRER